MEVGRVMEKLDLWKDAGKELEKGEEYLDRTEKLLYRRLWEYIIGENWPGVRQVTEALVALKII